MKKTLRKFAAVLCLFAAVALCGCSLLSGLSREREYEQTLAILYTAIAKCDGEMYTKALPPCYVDYFFEYNTALRVSGNGSIYDVFDKLLEQEYGDVYGDMQISHKVRSDSELSDDEAEEIADNLSKYSDDPIEIEEGRAVIVSVSITGSKKSEDFLQSATMVKIDGSWYCYMPLGDDE
jgi:hypothetical protein